MKLTLFTITLLLSTALFALDMDTVDKIFSDTSLDEKRVQASALAEAGRTQEAIELLFEVWQSERTGFGHLMVIAMLYNDINNPQMAGRFLLEGMQRSIDGHFKEDGLKKNFSNVWEDSLFVPYREKALALSRHRLND